MQFSNVFDKDLNYVFVEGQELDSMGFTSQNLIGKNYTNRFKGELADTLKDRFNAVFSGEGISFEFKKLIYAIQNKMKTVFHGHSKYDTTAIIDSL